ncbi:MAG: hypothetical protein HC888_07770 [Candidatus Competibacteraceae bacterium]|nr:hypothetical protein [Candidatus Competibacteraceae bacterium]
MPPVVRSQSIGRIFEETFHRVAPHFGVFVEDIPDGCTQRGRIIVRVKTPFDAILLNRRREGRNLAFVDFKTIQGDRFTYSQIHAKPHQMEALGRFHRRGELAGMLVWFRAEGTALAGLSGPITFFPFDTLERLEERESLRFDQGLHLGSFAEPNFHRVFTI